MINESKADWFHVDIMDGVFVPNISFGFPVMEALKRHAKKPLDVHLMIVNPDQFIDTFASMNTAILTVHYEACAHLHRTIQAIKAAGMKAGVAINPHTSVELLADVINDIDLVCMMSVNPGFGGQKFITNTFNKVKRLRQIITEHSADVKIEIDGGVTLDNYQNLLHAGADVLVAGSTVFKSEDPEQTISALKK